MISLSFMLLVSGNVYLAFSTANDNDNATVRKITLLQNITEWQNLLVTETSHQLNKIHSCQAPRYRNTSGHNDDSSCSSSSYTPHSFLNLELYKLFTYLSCTGSPG